MVDYIAIKCPRLNARINSHRSHPITVEALLGVFSGGERTITCQEYFGEKKCKSGEEYPNSPLECFYSKEGLQL